MPAHEIYHLHSESASLSFSGGELKVKEAGTSAGYGVRALDGGKLGFAYCQADDEVEKAIERAVRLSRFSVKSGFSFAPEKRFTTPVIFDPELAAMDYRALRGHVDEARKAAESKGGKARVMLSCGSSHVALQNTSGFSGTYDRTGFSV